MLPGSECFTFPSSRNDSNSPRRRFFHERAFAVPRTSLWDTKTTSRSVGGFLLRQGVRNNALENMCFSTFVGERALNFLDVGTLERREFDTLNCVTPLMTGRRGISTRKRQSRPRGT